MNDEFQTAADRQDLLGRPNRDDFTIGNPLLPPDTRPAVELIARSLPHPMVVVDGEQRVVFANRAFQRAFGFNPDETNGRPLYELADGQWNIPDLRRALASLLAGKGRIEDLRLVHRFGDLGQRALRVNACRIDVAEDGSPAALVAIEDESEFQEITRRLRESEQLYEMIFESATDFAIVTTDLDGGISTWNSGAQQVFGYTAQEISGRSASILFNEEDRAQGVPEMEMKQALETGRACEDRWMQHKDGSTFWASGVIMPLGGESDGAARGFVRILRNRTPLKESIEQQERLLAELNHRVKNTLTTVQAIASQTRQGARTIEQYLEAFEGRIRALARAHGILTRSDWKWSELTTLVTQAIEPYRNRERENLRMEGPAVYLRPRPTIAFSMILHELATNAAKYGALSVPQGRIEVQWQSREDESGLHLHFTWREFDGPAVRKPKNAGFGTKFIERSGEYDLGGRAKIDYRPGGLWCEMTIPMTGDLKI